MNLGLGSTLLPGDPRLIDHIVAEVKSQGIFDQFRKECIADVDTKPAYQNLNARVESSVNSFLNKQTWRADLNKNQLRETLRKHIHDAPYLEVGVDRIVDQVVNPKIYSVFMPKIEDVVYKYLGIERPKSQRNGVCDLKDLLPTDLDPVSPESDRGSIKDESMEIVEEDEKEIVNGDEEKPSVSYIESTPLEVTASPVKKEEANTEIEPEKASPVQPAMETLPVKAALNTSSETIKTEEEEEESPDFEPIDMNLNESNMSNDSHLSGISELTSHRSGSPDFATDFARDNFDCSNQDSQLSKVSSNSRLSIVTDIGSSNHGSTPKSDAKEDSKSAKDNLKAVKEGDTSKDSKFNFDVTKLKDNSKMSSSSKESSRDASDCKDSKVKDECRIKSSKDKTESRSSRDKDRDSRKRHSSKRRHRSRSRERTESDSQESKDYQKAKDIKIKEIEKKDEASDEVTDLKDRYKEKIRELREKIELTEKGKLGKTTAELPKEKKDCVSSKDKEESKKSGHKSSSSRSSSHHSKSSRSSESKESRDKSGSRHDERRHANGKGDSKSSSKSKRDGKSDRRSRDRSKDKKRRDEKKSKSTDDHSSLRKNLNERRSSDRDGSDGSSSKYSHKASFNANASSSKFGPSSELTKDSKEQHSSGETDSVHDSLQASFKSSDGSPKKIDPGSAEMTLPLKKRRLLSEESQDEDSSKQKRSTEKKPTKRKLDQLDKFKSDSDVACVPDEERVQIVEYADEEYDQPYPDKQLVMSLEETKKIILDADVNKPKLSEMELSIQQSLSEMMATHSMSEASIDPKKSEPKLSEMEQSIHRSLSQIIAGACKSSEPEVDPRKLIVVDDGPSAPSEPKFLEMEQSIHQSLSEMMSDQQTSEPDDVDRKMANPGEESTTPLEQSVSEMDQSIHESLTEMMVGHKTSEPDIEPLKVSTVMDSSSLLEALTDDSSRDKIAITATSIETATLNAKLQQNIQEAVNKSDQQDESLMEVQNDDKDDSKQVSESNKEQELDVKDKLSIENQLEEFEEFGGMNSESLEIEKEQSIEASEVKESTQNAVSEIEKSTDSEKEQSIEVPEVQKTTNTIIPDVEVEQSHGVQEVHEDTQKLVSETENSNDIEETASNTKYTDDLNQSNSDESNEDDNLVIDEDVDEKEKQSVDIAEVTPDQTDKSEESREKLRGDMKPKQIETLESVELMNESDVPSCEKPCKECKTERKVELTNELDENDSGEDESKQSTSDECASKDDTPIDIIKLDSPSKSQLDTEDDSDIDIVEIKEGDEAACETDDKLDEFDPLAEDSLDVERANVIEDQESADKTEQVVSDPLATEDNISASPHCSKADFRVDSPVEQDCRYFDNDNQKYLSFKKYLDRLEANLARSSARKSESPVVDLPAVVQMIEASATVSTSLKRKHTPSPIVDNLIKDNNNEDLIMANEELSNEQIPADEPVLTVKKRKIARINKSNTTSSSSQADQSQDREQQPQASIVNGENFMMPLSPDSDISVSSDKNLAANSREDRRAQRSSQRYSSDDLYKPRPLFSSSSRRTTRRYHQA